MHDLVALLIGLPVIAVWAEASRCRRLPHMRPPRDVYAERRQP